jgi:pSer/pThr/pTyr-binding forkhead associated (FHA) protein
VPESVLTILKFCFLALLYLFLYRVVRVVIAELRAPTPAPVSTPVARPAPSATEKPARGRGPARIRILEPAPRRGETYTLNDEVTIGRGGGCGIVLDDTFVSQVHARVFRRDGDVFVEDLGSRNGTLLNGKRLTAAQRLRRGDKVQFGRTVAEVIR